MSVGITVRKWRKAGISIIEVITAIAILSVGIWAVVTLFPKGQQVISRAGLRQLGTQLAREAVSDLVSDSSKMPFAVVPFDPTPLPDVAVLLEPAHLQLVRRTYNFVWGEPLELVPIDVDGDGQPDQWRTLLRFAPLVVGIADINHDGNVNNQDTIWVYREVQYRRVGALPPTQDYTFYFNPVSSKRDVYFLPVSRQRIVRITYRLEGSSQEIVRELYFVPENQNLLPLRQNADDVMEIVEEFPVPFDPSFLANGILRFLIFPNPPGASQGQLGALRVDYLIDNPDPINGGGGHWLIETGTTFEPDPALRQRLGIPLNVNAGVFQTTFGGLGGYDDDRDGKMDEDPIDGVNNDGDGLTDEDPPLWAIRLDPGPTWGEPLALALNNSSLQEGYLTFLLLAPNNPPLPPNSRVRVVYPTQPFSPAGNDLFVQAVKPPDDFQLFTGSDPDVLAAFPFERLRWFEVISPNPMALRFSRLLSGLNVAVAYKSPDNDGDGRVDEDQIDGTDNDNDGRVDEDPPGIETDYEEVLPINQDGTVALRLASSRLVSIRAASLLVRLSGRPLWQQAPPQRRSDYVELLTIVPSFRPQQP